VSHTLQQDELLKQIEENIGGVGDSPTDLTHDERKLLISLVGVLAIYLLSGL
jgi:hypothetical protein